MFDVLDLEKARKRALYAQSFPGEMEVAFRSSQRRLHELPRVGLFLIFALSFGLAPFYQQALFHPGESVVGLLHLIELGLVFPACALAALVTRFPIRRPWPELAHIYGVIAIFTGVLALRYLALQGQLRYPSQMIGVVMIAVAFFSGFSWQRVALGSLVLGALGIGLELWQDAGGDGALQSYALSLMTIIAVFGSYTHDLLSRIAWLNRRHVLILARTDALTRLSSRFEFNQMFPKVLAQGCRERRTVAVALMDVDHFKSINDRHGHLFGDEVLRALGTALRFNSGQRPLDLRVRYGGEEMLVVWYDVSRDSALLLAESLLETVRAIRLNSPAGDEVPLTASAGLTWLVPDNDTTPEQVLRQADALLYEAKAEGRDRVVYAPFQRPTD